MGALLQRAGFALPVTDVERLTVRYSSPFILMGELRRMGATNVLMERRRALLRRDTLKRMAQIYAERFADPDGKVRATFEIIWLSGWAPHESQQKPLRPGSAQTRLADALGTKEIGAGEKAGESNPCPGRESVSASNGATQTGSPKAQRFCGPAPRCTARADRRGGTIIAARSRLP